MGELSTSIRRGLISIVHRPLAIRRYHQRIRRYLGKALADDDHPRFIRKCRFCVQSIVRGLLHLFSSGSALIPFQYTLCDLVLLFQVYYYRRVRRIASSSTSESAPLLPSVPPAQPKPLLPPGLEYPLLLLFVLLSGVGAWYLSDVPDNVSIPEKPRKSGEVELEWRSQTLGWISAALYIGSRAPQISHN